MNDKEMFLAAMKDSAKKIQQLTSENEALKAEIVEYRNFLDFVKNNFEKHWLFKDAAQTTLLLDKYKV